ncbi:MAG: hypothetical protein K0S36_1367 [Nitrosospira multiformis]|jgi:hypothetical protein|nr:hypothetical protein [Nitrosospira multiformis]
MLVIAILLFSERWFQQLTRAILTPVTRISLRLNEITVSHTRFIQGALKLIPAHVFVVWIREFYPFAIIDPIIIVIGGGSPPRLATILRASRAMS